MTTLEEIAVDEKANYEFWTAGARLCLACYRSTGCKLEKSGFHSNLKNRRLKTYLIKENQNVQR